MHESLELLQRFVPTLFMCATRTRRDVESVRNKYRERRKSLRDALSARGEFAAMSCVFDIIWSATDGDDDAAAFLKFVDQVARDALACAGVAMRPSVEKLVVRMITSFGEQRSEYKNHLAELAVLRRLVADKAFVLLAIEKALPNGCSIDFEVSLSGSTQLVEVYNVSFEADRLRTTEDLRVFLENRLVAKLNAKLEGISKLSAAIVLVPVLWGDMERLLPFEAALDYVERSGVVGPVMMVGQYRNRKTGQASYRFGRVKDFLVRVRQQPPANLA